MIHHIFFFSLFFLLIAWVSVMYPLRALLGMCDPMWYVNIMRMNAMLSLALNKKRERMMCEEMRVSWR